MLIKEKSIANSLIEYIRFFRECGILCSRKETIEVMQEAYDKYCK